MNRPEREVTRAEYEERLLRVLVHVQNHLDEALPLDHLASIAHFSPFHFHRIFRGMVGESVQAYVRRLRLERAAHRLKYGEDPVTRVAFDAGYEAHEAFTRAFRARFECSPSDYRKRHSSASSPGASEHRPFRPDEAKEALRSEIRGVEMMDVRVETVDRMGVVFMRHTGPYDQVGATWTKLFTWAGMRGLIGPNVMPFGVVYDDPAVTVPDCLRYDACLGGIENAAAEGAIGAQTVGGGCYAVVRHTGPYDTLGDTYARLCGAWLPDSGRELRSAPALEFYRNSPMGTPPEALVTDIYMPLED